MTSIAEMDIMTLTHAYRRGELSPVEVLEATFASAQRADDQFNAFVHFDYEGAMKAAQASTRRWAKGESISALDGVPLPIKDTHPVIGWPAPRMGSFLLPGSEVSTVDSPLVSLLRGAGAILFARTLSSELGWKGVGDNPVYGATKNPWSPAHTPGGSSAGAAVSVAAGVTRIAQGGDGGGSIRIPANFSGIFGMKPTAHRIGGGYPTMGALPNQGLLTTTARESASVYDIVTAPYEADSHQLPFAKVEPIGEGVEGMRIAHTADFGFPGIDPEVAGAVDAAAEALEIAGAIIIPVELDFTEYRSAIEPIWSLGFRSITGPLDDEKRSRMDPGLVEMVDAADQYSAMDLQSAHEAQARLSNAFREVEMNTDLVLSCTSLVQPPLVGEDYPAEGTYTHWFDWAGPTWTSNMSRRPAANIPFTLSESGLPIGVQLTGPLLGEREIFRASIALEDIACFSNHKHPEFDSTW